MKLYSAFLLIFLSFTFISAKAQLGRGCLVAGVLYTQKTAKSNMHFYRSPGNLTSSCGFTRTGNTGNCRLYNSGNINNNTSYTLYSGAFSNNWMEISCPIDDYTWPLLISISTLVVIKLKSRFAIG